MEKIILTIRNIKFRLYYLTLFKIKTGMRRFFSKSMKYNRPASFPYITGDGFRSIAQHVFDEIQTIQFGDVAEGDIVFVRADFLHDFFKKVHPCIENKYILISHNSDQNINSQFVEYIDDKIIHWFAQNVLVAHKKITPLPIGLQLRIYNAKNIVIELLEKNKIENEKDIKIFYAFSEETNGKRSTALRHLKNNVLTTGSSTALERSEYYKAINKNAFNASPEGGGIDCHRTWESMYLGSIPVLERNVSTSYWQDIGLPVFLIDSWGEIDTIQAKNLEEFYIQSKSKFNSPALYIDYWITEIIKHKHAR